MSLPAEGERPDDPPAGERPATVRERLAADPLPLIWGLLTALSLIPVWAARLLPLVDLPNHLAQVAGWVRYAEPAFRISEFYRLEVRPGPYSLCYWLMYALGQVVSIETANKLYLSAYLILFPLSVGSLAAALGRSRWLTLGAFVLAWNGCWGLGFTSFLGGLVALFFGLAALARFLDRGRWRNLVALAAWTALTYFGHLLCWLCFGLAAGGFLLQALRQPRRVALASAVMLPSAAVMLLASRNAAETQASGWVAEMANPLKALAIAPWYLFHTTRGPVDLIAGGVVCATTAYLLWRLGWRAGRVSSSEGRLLVMVALFTLLYLALPTNIHKPVYYWYISPRLLTMLAPALLLLPAGAVEGRLRLAFAPLVLACVGLFGWMTYIYRDFDRRNAPFVALIEQTELGAATLVVSDTLRGDDRASLYKPNAHAPCYPMALRGGYCPTLFDISFVPLHFRRKLPAPSVPSPASFSVSLAPDFDYYLVRLPPASMDRSGLAEVASRGEWTLFRRAR